MSLNSTFYKVSVYGAWITLAVIAFATLSPIEGRPSLAGPQVEHFVAFATMGCAFAFGYPKRTPMVVAIVIGSAFCLEALQLLTPDRHARIVDALVKAAGGIVGTGIGRLSGHGPEMKTKRPNNHAASAPPDDREKSEADTHVESR